MIEKVFNNFSHLYCSVYANVIKLFIKLFMFILNLYVYSIYQMLSYLQFEAAISPRLFPKLLYTSELPLICDYITITYIYVIYNNIII